jgi:hypothetical protein
MRAEGKTPQARAKGGGESEMSAEENLQRLEAMFEAFYSPAPLDSR